MTVKEVLKVRKYKAGYELRTELHDGSEWGVADLTFQTAYTHSGDYIGDTKRAYRLCKKMGIKPEKIGPTYNVCSIGFCKKEQKWCGWSHRAIFGFGIGSTTKKGDCGFTPSNVLELFASLSDDERKRVVTVDADKITIEHTSYSAVPVNPGEHEGEMTCSDPKIDYHTIEIGRGEWKANTLDEAKQMAIDFARSVS